MPMHNGFEHRFPRTLTCLLLFVLGLASPSTAQDYTISAEKRTQIEAAVSKFMSSRPMFPAFLLL